MKKIPIKAFLFDIGSTLVFGPDISPSKRISEILFNDDQKKDSIAQVIMKNDFPGPEHVVDYLKQIYQISSKQSQEIKELWLEQEVSAKEIDGASHILSALKYKGYKLGVISDIWKPYYTSFCESLAGVLKMLDCQALSFREGVKKPSHEFFLRAAKELDTNPQETVVVGDTYHKDIKPAIELNFQTVWYLSRPEREGEALREVIMDVSAKPSEVITDLKQLLEWIS